MVPPSETLALTQAETRRRPADFLVLTKPRLVTLVLVTTLVGFIVGSGGRVDLVLLAWTILGTGLTAGGALALNQYLERDVDGRMERTRRRPLPDGRLAPTDALVFGAACAAAGLLVLALLANLLACAVTAATFGIYLAAYTPLKRISSLATIVGAVPGALPPVTGWAAARGDLSAGAWTLFAIMFLWQIPHFLALAWMYKDEYARAGIVVLPSSDPDGRLTGRQMVAYLAVLTPVSLAPAALGLAGPFYVLCALALSSAFLALGVGFALVPSRDRARRVFLGSLAYVPALLALLVFARKPL